jgi:hypothetical protein
MQALSNILGPSWYLVEVFEKQESLLLLIAGDNGDVAVLWLTPHIITE